MVIINENLLLLLAMTRQRYRTSKTEKYRVKSKDNTYERNRDLRNTKYAM